jgi:hypothetical protein
LGGCCIAGVGIRSEGGRGRGQCPKDQTEVVGVMEVSKDMKEVVLVGLGRFVEILG